MVYMLDVILKLILNSVMLLIQEVQIRECWEVHKVIRIVICQEMGRGLLLTIIDIYTTLMRGEVTWEIIKDNSHLRVIRTILSDLKRIPKWEPLVTSNIHLRRIRQWHPLAITIGLQKLLKRFLEEALDH